MLHTPLQENAGRFDQKSALICGQKSLSFAELEHASNRLANALLESGLKKSERVAIYLENSTESLISIYAISKAGGVFVTIHPQTKEQKLFSILQDCSASVLITQKNPGAQVLALKSLKQLILTGPFEPPEKKDIFHCHLSSFEEIQKEHKETFSSLNLDPSGLCSLIYTSGSSGTPKGVMMSHENMRSASAAIISYLNNRPEDVILNLLPLSFDYGLYNCLMPVEFGGTVVLEKAYLYPFQILGLVERHLVSGLPLIPSIIALLLQFRGLKVQENSTLRYITNTGQALLPEHGKRLQELFDRVEIFSMYGLTECKRVSYLQPHELHLRPHSVGKAMPGLSVEIVSERGEPVASPGEIGELVVEGPTVMQGYWNSPGETKKRIKIDPASGRRRLYTGDLFYQDEEGFLYFVSRKDDLIKTAGERVHPQEVEDVLCQLEQVQEAAVVPVEHKILGQALKACVVCREGITLSSQEILEHCKNTLEPAMVPKEVEFVSSLAKTMTGKIDKKRLQKKAVKV